MGDLLNLVYAPDKGQALKTLGLQLLSNVSNGLFGATVGGDVGEMGLGGDPFAAHAIMRQDLGLPPAGSAGDNATLANLTIGNQSFWGINGHGQDMSAWKGIVNPITATHAEGDVFNQAAEAGIVGGNATLTVDRALCNACGQNGGVRSMARFLGLDSLLVVSPEGSYSINLYP